MLAMCCNRIYLFTFFWMLFILLSCSKNQEEPNNNSNVLPKRLIVKPAPFVEEMNSTEGWTLITGTSLTLNNTEVHSGTGSIKLVSNVGENSSMSKLVKWDLSSDQGKSFKLWVYPHSDPSTTISGFYIYAHNDDWSNVFGLSLSGGRLLKQNEWTMLWLDPEATHGWIVSAGNPSWSEINKIRIIVKTTAGQTSICSFDLMSEGEVRKPAILLSFDDDNISDYTKAYPLLKSKNMVATSYIVSSSINQNGRLTSEQLQELYSNGWDIGNHSKTHPNLTGLSRTDIEKELNGCKLFLDSLGLIRASQHVAYPDGAYNDDVINTMSSWSAKTGRTVSGYFPLYEIGTFDLGFPFEVNCHVAEGTQTLRDIEDIIDESQTLNAPIAISFHSIIDTGTEAYNWPVELFSGLLDYIESLGIQTLTIDEYYKLNTGSIIVNHK